jgi:hypothetical protein
VAWTYLKRERRKNAWIRDGDVAALVRPEYCLIYPRIVNNDASSSILYYLGGISPTLANYSLLLCVGGGWLS